MWTDEEIRSIKKVLRYTRGYIVFPVDDDEMILMRKKDLNSLRKTKPEAQLNFASAQARNQETIQDVTNKEISPASEEIIEPYGFQQDHIPIENTPTDNAERFKKVRFEPIKGDLPPELQE